MVRFSKIWWLGFVHDTHDWIGCFLDLHLEKEKQKINLSNLLFRHGWYRFWASLAWVVWLLLYCNFFCLNHPFLVSLFYLIHVSFQRFSYVLWWWWCLCGLWYFEILFLKYGLNWYSTVCIDKFWGPMITFSCGSLFQ